MVDPSIKICHGDLTVFSADCILNAANANLDPGGGLDGAIRAAAGALLNVETADQRSRYGPLRDGNCIITRPYGITTARAIVHSAAPDLRRQGNMADRASETLLFNCYYLAFKKASDFKLTSIAIPILGSGIYCYPLNQSLLIAVQAIISFMQYETQEYLKTFTIVILSGTEYQRAVSILSGKSVIDISSPIAAWSEIERHNFPIGSTRRTRNQLIPYTQRQVDLTSFYDVSSASTVPSTSTIPLNAGSNWARTEIPSSRSFSPRVAPSVKGGRGNLSAEELEEVRRKGREKSAAYRARKRELGDSQLSLPSPSKRKATHGTSSESIVSSRNRSASPQTVLQGRGSRCNLPPDQLEELRRNDREEYAARRGQNNLSEHPSMSESLPTLSPQQIEETRQKDKAYQSAKRKNRNTIESQSNVPSSSSRSLAPILVPVIPPPLQEPSVPQSEFQRRRALLSQYDPSIQMQSNSVRSSVNVPSLIPAQIGNVQHTTQVPQVYRSLPGRHDLGDFDNVCPFCNARNFAGVRKCCNNGKVWIDPPRELPEPLKRLITECDSDFMKNIVAYNSLLAMASLSYTKQPVGPMGVQAAKVLGSVTHWPSALFPNQSRKEAFGNFYVYEAKNATAMRQELDIADGLNPDVLEELHECLLLNHPLAQCYRTMYRELRKEIDEGRDASRLKMRIVDRFEADKMNIDLQQHSGTYSVPSGKDFLCVFFSCNTNQAVLPRGLTVYSLNGCHSPREIKSYIRMVDSLCYPFIFPYGGGVWEAGRIPIERTPRLYQQRMEGITARDRLADDTHETDDYLQQSQSMEEGELENRNEFMHEDVQDAELNEFHRENTPENQTDFDEEFNSMNRTMRPGTREAFIREERGGEIYIRRGEPELIPAVDGYMSDDSGGYEFDRDDVVDDIEPTSQLNEQIPLESQERDRAPQDEVNHQLMDMQLNSQRVENIDEEDQLNVQPPPLNLPDDDLLDLDFDARRVPQAREFVSMRDSALFLNRYPLGGPSWIAQYRKLGQLHLIDVQTRIIHQRMEHIQKNFTQTMSTTKRRLLNAIQNNLLRNGQKIKVGAVTVVPSHVPGSPRYMRLKFEEAVALANLFGRPDLFITFTANVKWSEIKELLKPGETFADHPHIVAEVFKKKLDEFLKDVVGVHDRNHPNRPRRGIFGEVLWYVFSIEFQQRGPPHLHLVVSLVNHIETTQRIDEIVSARIPPLPSPSDPEYENVKNLRELVVSHMVHTPCEHDPNAYCQKEKPAHWKLCTKRFPKEFSSETSFGDRSYPDYLRPNDGETCTKYINRRAIITDNSYVVPYSPYLLSKYQSHINCEVISSVKVISYLFKYIFKGFDRSILEAFESFGEGSTSSIVAGGKIVQTGHILHSKKLNQNEIEERNRVARQRLREQGVAIRDENNLPVLVYDETSFIEDLRAMTSCEAAYEIRGYLRCVSSHSVVTLYVHLEHDEPVQYIPGNEQDAINRIDESGVESRLTAWFKVNQKQGVAGDTARRLTFDQMPKYFMYTRKQWQLRKKDLSARFVGRIKAVQPRFLELFAIRLLCLNRTGITGFDQLRTVDGVLMETFVAAAKSLRLMNDEEEWHMALTEASTLSSPVTMRRLFISILSFCSPKNAKELWLTHMDSFLENKPAWSIAQRIAHCLFHLQSGLRVHELTLAQFGLPEVVLDDLPPRNEIIDDNDGSLLSADRNSELGQDMYLKLNPEQKVAVDAILASSRQSANSNRTFFLEGVGGTGKTYVYKCLYHLLECSGKKVLCVAHTGIAATLLMNGSTAHRAFGIPIQIDDSLTSRLNFEGYQAQHLAGIDCIIWDEATMTDRRIYEAVDNLLRIVHNRPNVFMGGILTVFGGDWQQTLPIVEGVTEEAVPAYTLKSTELWKSLTILRLVKNQRAANDQGYSDFLLKVGRGANDDVQNHLLRLPVEICMTSEAKIIDWLYSGEFRGNGEPNMAKSLLTVDNRTSLELNEKILNSMPGISRTYSAIDSTDTSTGFLALDSDAYKTMTPSGMPPFHLNLKIGSHVILLRNQSVLLGLCNGSRLRVLQLGDDIIKCEPLTPGLFTPRVVDLHRMDMSPARAPTKEFSFIRHQFPLRLCYAMTINKSQGQTLDRVGVILRTPCFSHGQLYVALSRVRSRSDIRVYNCRTTNTGVMSQYVTNKVLASILM